MADTLVNYLISSSFRSQKKEKQPSFTWAWTSQRNRETKTNVATISSNMSANNERLMSQSSASNKVNTECVRTNLPTIQPCALSYCPSISLVVLRKYFLPTKQKKKLENQLLLYTLGDLNTSIGDQTSEFLTDHQTGSQSIIEENFWVIYWLS